MEIFSNNKVITFEDQKVQRHNMEADGSNITNQSGTDGKSTEKFCKGDAEDHSHDRNGVEPIYTDDLIF